MRVEIIRESVKASERVVFEAYDNGFEFGWKAKITENQAEEVIRLFKAKLEKRKDNQAHGMLYEIIYNKMKFKLPKTDPMHPDMLKSLPEALICITNEFKKIYELDKFKPKQKTMAEAMETDPSLGKVKQSKKNEAKTLAA